MRALVCVQVSDCPFNPNLCCSVPGHSSVNYHPQETRSRLSKTVDQVLRDNVALPHYTHFTEVRGVEHLVRFWSEAERFRSSSWSRVRAHSLNSVKHSSLAEPVPVHAADLQQVSPHATTLAQSPPECRSSSSSETELGPVTEPRPGTPGVETPSKQQASSRTGTPYKGQPSGGLRELSDTLMKSE